VNEPVARLLEMRLPSKQPATVLVVGLRLVGLGKPARQVVPNAKCSAAVQLSFRGSLQERRAKARL
jgi:hypothetical protein